MSAFMTLAMLAVITFVAAAQEPKPAPTAPPPASAASALPTPPPNFEYQPDGRRDPFLSLVNRGTDSRGTTATGTRPDGIGGIAVNEVVVRGILQSRAGWVAMIA